MLHAVIDGGAADAGRCDCWELGEKAAESVLGQGHGVQRGLASAEGEGAAVETHGGERLRVDEAAASDVD